MVRDSYLVVMILWATAGPYHPLLTIVILVLLLPSSSSSLHQAVLPTPSISGENDVNEGWEICWNLAGEIARHEESNIKFTAR